MEHSVQNLLYTLAWINKMLVFEHFRKKKRKKIIKINENFDSITRLDLLFLLEAYVGLVSQSIPDSSKLSYQYSK